MDEPVRQIRVLSDSTGATAERVMRAALLQFPQSEVRIEVHSRVRTQEAARPLIERAVADGALLVCSVVSPELSEFIHQLTVELGGKVVDVIGTAIAQLSGYLKCEPLNRPGALMPLGEDYFRRIEAVEFTVRSDAGRDPRNFLKADLILVGVSRTSKTPLATLLAQRGFKVANQTLVIGNQPPAELLAAQQDRIVALTIDVDSLCEIRQERLRKLGMPIESRYAVRDHVREEVEFAEHLYRDNPDWLVVEMTGRSVEETAGIILEQMRDRLSSPPGE